MTPSIRLFLLALLIAIAAPLFLLSQLPAPQLCGTTACYLCDGNGEACYCLEAQRLLTDLVLTAASDVSYWDCEELMP